MTAAVFEARICPTWLNEIKKTKLYTYTSPAAGINFLLWPVGFVNCHHMPLNSFFNQFLVLDLPLLTNSTEYFELKSFANIF